jgi:hypothetical protein
MRMHWWLVFVLVGVLLAVVGLTVLSGMAQFLVFCIGVALVASAIYRRVAGPDSWEPPGPPGGTPGPPIGF